MYNFGQTHWAMNLSDLPFYLLEWVLYHSGIIHTRCCNISLVYDLLLTLQCHMIRYDYVRGLIIRTAALERFTVLNYWCIIANCLVINFTLVINMNRDNRVYVLRTLSRWLLLYYIALLLPKILDCYWYTKYALYQACKVQQLGNNNLISKRLLGFSVALLAHLRLYMMYGCWCMYNWVARVQFYSYVFSRHTWNTTFDVFSII